MLCTYCLQNQSQSGNESDARVVKPQQSETGACIMVLENFKQIVLHN